MKIRKNSKKAYNLIFESSQKMFFECPVLGHLAPKILTSSNRAARCKKVNRSVEIYTKI